MTSVSASRPTPSQGMGILAMVAMGILLGTIPLFKEILADRLSAAGISLSRVVIAFVAVGAFVMLRRMSVAIQWRDVGTFVGFGLVSVAMTNYFYIKSLTCTTTAVASVTVFVAAPLTTLIVGHFTGKKTGLWSVSCIMVIIGGCILVNTDMKAAGETQYLLGMMYAALCGFCFGLFSLFGNRLAQNYNFPVMMFWQFLIATLFTLAATLIFDFQTVTSLGDLNRREIAGVIGLGVFATFLPYFLYSYGLKNAVSPSTASALTLLEPVSAVLLASVILHENISLTQAIGIGVVVVGSIMLIFWQPGNSEAK